ncbi:glutaminyl-peptide cyclotransferase [Maricaulis salignorans]|uniref:Glutaminyl-peptide cyclotransferase n=1 Tax=Maricaulis salignorans TaxID=144026 RepID=A0A1G9VX20_9PROT|nr:glutaminyl-peptide cyclotransferase [Maricaulis salignorans]SDM76784.1 glutaminyl-peptide cyclotransferase [Maricaulis salignorans]
MKLLLPLTVLAWLAMPLSACAQPARAQVQQAELVATYPHDEAAFTQGLFMHDGALFESTGQVGQSSLRRVELETGNVLQQVNINPPVFGEGSARIGDAIYMLSWLSQTGMVFDAASFELIDQFSYPGEGWGLTTDGTRLILSDGSPQLRFLEPETMELTGTLDVTLNGRLVRRINELEWVADEIWANIWQTSTIVRIDPQTGIVTGLVDLTALLPAGLADPRDAVANGIAWNRETGQIYVTGKLWPVLYEIRLPDSAE